MNGPTSAQNGFESDELAEGAPEGRLLTSGPVRHKFVVAWAMPQDELDDRDDERHHAQVDDG